MKDTRTIARRSEGKLPSLSIPYRKSQVDSTVNLIDVQSNGGIHAPTIRYKDGVYYIITTNVYYDEELKKANMVNFIITAENPAGPWSDPIHILGAPGIDPDLFFDDDGKVLIFHRSPGPVTFSF